MALGWSKELGSKFIRNTRGELVNRHGITKEKWDSSKNEARNIMVVTARNHDKIAYSELTAKIRSVKYDPHGLPFSDLLGEISKEENAAGRGMLSAIVVHKNGDGRPGEGFFWFAKNVLGRDTSDREAFWIKEVTLVHEKWSKR